MDRQSQKHVPCLLTNPHVLVQRSLRCTCKAYTANMYTKLGDWTHCHIHSLELQSTIGTSVWVCCQFNLHEANKTALWGECEWMIYVWHWMAACNLVKGQYGRSTYSGQSVQTLDEILWLSLTGSILSRLSFYFSDVIFVWTMLSCVFSSMIYALASLLWFQCSSLCPVLWQYTTWLHMYIPSI